MNDNRKRRERGRKLSPKLSKEKPWFEWAEKATNIYMNLERTIAMREKIDKENALGSSSRLLERERTNRVWASEIENEKRAKFSAFCQSEHPKALQQILYWGRAKLRCNFLYVSCSWLAVIICSYKLYLQEPHFMSERRNIATPTQ